nr:uncharacterized protein LOC113399433 [Vanessa tameamea]
MAPVEMEPLKVMAMPIKQYSLISNPSKNDWQLKIPEGNSDRGQSETRPVSANILNALESYYPIKSRDKSVENSNVNNKEIENIHFNKFSDREQSSTIEKLIRPKMTEQKISQSIIKEIANSVKELVLNDLRKEIFQTTASYTTTEKLYNTKFITTKRELIAPTVKIENSHVEQTILNKFMDLFEEIKTLNHKTLILSGENKKDNVLKEETIHYTYPGVVPKINNRMVNTQSNYKTKQYIDSKSKKIYNFSQQLHKFRSNISASIIEAPKKRALPITFQTNNMEIPPLGIPVDKPENPINQNIIVTTMRPYRIGESGVDDEKIISDSRNNYIPKISEIRILKSHEPTPYDLNHQNDKILTITNRDTDRLSLHRYKQPVHRGDGVKRGPRPRFHEKLERERDYFDNTKQREYTNRVDCCDERYAYSKQMVDCCNRKIASRQQMSLNHMKKLSSYDDTHFNNFLKSQKKVTDMLERILASRSRVRSVETA